MSRTISPTMSLSSMGSRDGVETVDQQLQVMSARLSYVLHRLGEQREKSMTKRERKHLDQLRREATKQAVAIMKLQDSVEESLAVMAKSSQALDSVGVTSDGSEMLCQVVTVPFLGRHSLRQQRRSMDLRNTLQLWTRAKTMARQTLSGINDWSLGSETTQWQLPRTTPMGSELPIPPIYDPPTPPEEVGDANSASIHSNDAQEEVVDSDAASIHSNATSFSSYSPYDESPRISIQDWSILTPPEGESAAPPLPRKSSRRANHTPRVPSVKRPSMPMTPPPSIPESATYFSFAESPDDLNAQALFSNLEKRFSLTMKTPPTTPSPSVSKAAYFSFPESAKDTHAKSIFLNLERRFSLTLTTPPSTP